MNGNDDTDPAFGVPSRRRYLMEHEDCPPHRMPRLAALRQTGMFLMQSTAAVELRILILRNQNPPHRHRRR